MADNHAPMKGIGFGSGLGVLRDQIRPQLDALASGLKALQAENLDAHGLADLWRQACTIKDRAMAQGIHDVCAAAQLMEEAMHMISHDKSHRTPGMVGFLQEMNSNIAQRVEQHDNDLPLDALRQTYHALLEGEAGGEPSPSDIDAIKHSFYAEVKQQLALAHRCLVALGKGEVEDDGLEALHRLAGNIRISATMMGIEDVADAGHFLEDASEYLIRYPEQRGPAVGRNLIDMHDQLHARLDEHAEPLSMEEIRQSFINAVMESKRAMWTVSRPAQVETLPVPEVEAQSPPIPHKEATEIVREDLAEAEPASTADEDETLDTGSQLDWDLATGDVTEAALQAKKENGGVDAVVEEEAEVGLGFDLQPQDMENLELDTPESANAGERSDQDGWSERTVELKSDGQVSPAEDQTADEPDASEQVDANEEAMNSPFVEWNEVELEPQADESGMPEVGQELPEEANESEQVEEEASSASTEGWNEAEQPPVDESDIPEAELKSSEDINETEQVEKNSSNASLEDRNEAEPEWPADGTGMAEAVQEPLEETEGSAEAESCNEADRESSEQSSESDQIVEEDEASNIPMDDWSEASFEAPGDELVLPDEASEHDGELGMKEQAESESESAVALETAEHEPAVDLSSDDFAESVEDHEEQVQAGSPDRIEDEEDVRDDGELEAEEEVASAAEAVTDEVTDDAAGQEEQARYDFRPDVPELAPEDSLSQADSMVRVEAERLTALAARVNEFGLDKSGTETVALSVRSMLGEMHDMQDMWPAIRRGPSSANIGEYKADLQSMDTFLYKQPQVTRQVIKALRKESDRQAMLVDDLRAQLKGLMKGSLGSLFSRLPAHVQHLAHKYDRQLRLCVDGASVELLCSMMEAVEEMLLVLIEHAIAHGIEPAEERTGLGKPEDGQITIAARQLDGEVLLEVINDGCGLDPNIVREAALGWGVCDQEELDSMDEDEVLGLIFAPGMPAGGSDEDQRGAGMSTMQNLIRGLGGRVKIHSELEKGTCIGLALPLGVPLRSVVVLGVGGHHVGILADSVLQMIALGDQEIQEILNTDGAMAITYAGEMVPLVDLRGEESEAKQGRQPMVVVARHAEGLVGIVVDGFEEKREVELFEPDAYIERCCPSVYEGLTILDDNSILLLVNPAGVVDMLKITPAEASPSIATPGSPSGVAKGNILMMEGAISDNRLSEELLHGRGYHVDAVVEGEELIERLDARAYDLVIVDLDIPNSGGLKLVRRVRNHERLEYIPVMAVSISDRPEDRLRGLEAGADAYIEKQHLDMDNCLNTVDALIHIYKAQIPDDAATLHECSSPNAGPDS